MKKLLPFASVLVLNLNVFGQAVPNGTFENWNSTAYNDPNGWNNGNWRDIQRMGVSSVTKATGQTGFALRMETIVIGSDTSDSYIINTDNPCSDPDQWTGGVPYSQQPTALTGYYRYNLPGNDTALILVIFRKNGVHIGDNLIKIRGTGSQSAWTSFSFPVSCSGVPDSLIIAATSSNKITNQGIQNGSFLELDNLGFSGATQAIPDGGFENWTAKSYDVPSGWESWSNGVSKTTSSYSGNFAIRMETTSDECGGAYVNSSGITTGYMTDTAGPAGGLPYTNTNDTLCGWYKYTSMGGSNGGIYVSLSKNGSPVGGNNKSFSAASVYTYFEMPFQAGITPDTIRVDIQSAEWPVSSANIGSVLYIDNLYLKSSALGIFDASTSLSVTTFPNPVKEILSIRFEKNLSGILNLFIYDETGRKVEINGMNRNASSMRIDVSNLSSGIYFYEIRTAEGVMRNKFIKE